MADELQAVVAERQTGRVPPFGAMIETPAAALTARLIEQVAEV